MILGVVRGERPIEHWLGDDAVVAGCRVYVQRIDWGDSQVFEARALMLGINVLRQRHPIAGPISGSSGKERRMPANNYAPAIET